MQLPQSMKEKIFLMMLLASSCCSFQGGVSRFAHRSPLVVAQPTKLINSALSSSGKGFGGGGGGGGGVDDNAPPRPSTTSDDIERAEGKSLAKAALAKMRRQKVERKDAELRKIKEMKEIDESLKENPGGAAIPEKVAMRMGSRMLPFVGIPLIGGMGAFVAFWYFATYKDMEFQPALVALTTIVTLVAGLLGITYSIMSTSWDEDREGSFLGLDEFGKNVNSIKGGVSRSGENALLRERMAGMPEEEIEAAIRDLDRRDADRVAGKR